MASSDSTSDLNSFADLMQRLRTGDQAAANELYARYAARLASLAWRRLNVRLRAKVEPDEVMHSVLKTFFRRHQQGEFLLAGWDDLWSLLVTITLRKCGHRIDYHLAARRDARRELSLSADAAPAYESMAREPTPEQAAALAELVASIHDGLGDERERTIFTLALEGSSASEIAESVAHSERTVQRVLARVRAKLESSPAGDE